MHELQIGQLEISIVKIEFEFFLSSNHLDTDRVYRSIRGRSLGYLSMMTAREYFAYNNASLCVLLKIMTVHDHLLLMGRE